MSGYGSGMDGGSNWACIIKHKDDISSSDWILFVVNDYITDTQPYGDSCRAHYRPNSPATMKQRMQHFCARNKMHCVDESQPHEICNGEALSKINKYVQLQNWNKTWNLMVGMDDGGVVLMD